MQSKTKAMMKRKAKVLAKEHVDKLVNSA